MRHSVLLSVLSVSVCVCLQRATGLAVSEPYNSQRARSVCVSLSAFFILACSGAFYKRPKKKNSCIEKKCRIGVHKSSGTSFARVPAQLKHWFQLDVHDVRRRSAVLR